MADDPKTTEVAPMRSGADGPLPPTRERGPWRAGRQEPHPVTGIYLESDDFTHDARLYVYGDFRDDDERFAYAGEIARRLNAWKLEGSASVE